MSTKLIEAELKSTRVVPFSGKKEDWDMWQIKHVGRSRVRGTYGVLTGTEKVPFIAAGKAPTASQEEIIELNIIAYNDLLQSCSEAISFNLVRTGVTNECPDGSAAQAWKNLCSKYSPNTVAEKIRLKKELQQLKLEHASDDPDVWLTKLELIRMKLIQFKAGVSDDDLMMHVLNNLPSDYNQLIVTMEYMMSKDELDMNNMREMLNLAFSRMNPGGNVEEKALAAKHYTKQFKKNCRICGQQAHKAEDCWEKEENKHKRPANWKSRLPGKTTTPNTNNSNSTKKYEGECGYCHKKGHKESECRKKIKEAANIAQQQNDTDHVMIVDHAMYAGNQNTWIGDTGATSHMTNNDFGMFDCSTTSSSVFVGNGKALKASKIGKLKLQSVIDGKSTSFTLKDVLYVPELSGNLFSLTKGIQNGYELKSMKIASTTSLVLSKNNFKLIFSKKDSNLLSCDLERVVEEGHVAACNTKVVDINLYHNMIGHPSQEITKQTALKYNVAVKGDLEKCEHCAISKAKQKAVPKISTNRAQLFGERIFFDLSWIKGTSLGGSNFWLLAVDECTKFCWSRFLKLKSDLKHDMINIIDDIETICIIKQLYIKTVFLRCDNASENKSFQQEIMHDKPKIKFEFTSPKTPQQNGVVERAFATLKGRARSMLNFAGMQGAKRIQLWCEAAGTATKITNILVKNNHDKCAHEKVYDQLPSYAHKLRVFGEIGIISNTGEIQTATQDRGIKCIFLGYAEDHSSDVYRFYNMQTGKVKLSRDVIWINKTYHEDQIQPVGLNKYYQADDDEEEEEIMPMRIGNNAPVIIPPPPPLWVDQLQDELTEVYEHRTRSGKTQALVHLHDADHYCFLSEEPLTYKEAINSPDAKHWIEAMKTELQSMVNKKVWRTVKKIDIPTDKKLIGCRWVFKLKDNGIFRARLVALGYSQRPGVDFTDYYAPVVNDTTMKIVILMSLTFGFSTEQTDIETAFLYGDLDEEVYMKLPPGFDQEGQGEAVLLQKSIYGLVQAAFEWNKKATKILKLLGFQQCKSDPCLFMHPTKMVYIIIYVDDCLLVGKPAVLQQIISQLKEHLVIKCMGKIKDYIGCNVEETNYGYKYTQSKLIQRMTTKFADELSTIKYIGKTPVKSNEKIYVAENDSEIINSEGQTSYRSGIGMLLYLVKYSRPDIANCVRELAKMSGKATVLNYNQLLRCIKYVDTTKHYGTFALKSTAEYYSINAFCDSDYAGDYETRRSTSGYIIYINGSPIVWKSKGQERVAYSSTEAEYIAMSNACKEIMFIIQLMQQMNLKVTLPALLHVDNMGAIYLSASQMSSQRTKHIDIRHHGMKEYIEDGFIKVIFVRSEDNDSDIFTKNLGYDLHDKHSSKFLKKK